MQAMAALDIGLPPWLAQETTISALLQAGEERGRADDLLGITTPEDRLKMRPVIMMIIFATISYVRKGIDTLESKGSKQAWP